MSEYRDKEKRRTLAKLSPAAREVWEELSAGGERSKTEAAHQRRKLALRPVPPLLSCPETSEGGS